MNDAMTATCGGRRVLQCKGEQDRPSEDRAEHCQEQRRPVTTFRHRDSPDSEDRGREHSRDHRAASRGQKRLETAERLLRERYREREQENTHERPSQTLSA